MTSVPSQLPTDPFNRMAFVGEAPSDVETERGLPFVGPSGKVFDAILRNANVDRVCSYVGNVFDSQLLDNDIGKHQAAMGDTWRPFLERNLARLHEEIDACKPHVIVPMGATALRAICGNGNISAARGSVIKGAGPFAGYKVLPTYHPAYILRTWKCYAIAIADVIKAAEEAARGPAIRFPKVWIIINPTLQEVEVYLRECRESGKLVSVDIETGWGMVRGISFSFDKSHALYIPFIDLRKPSKSYWGDARTETEVWHMVCDILEDRQIPKLGQNFSGYDIHWLRQKMGIRVMGFTHDTRLLHKALYAELPASLAFMASSYSMLPGWKHWGKAGGAKKNRGDKRDE